MISRSVSRIISLREGTLRRGGRKMCCSRRDRDIWIMSCRRGRLSRGRRSRRCDRKDGRTFSPVLLMVHGVMKDQNRGRRLNDRA
jgi:hypothetical protein